MARWVEFATPWGYHLVDLDRVFTVTRDPEISIGQNPNGSILWFGVGGTDEDSKLLPVCVSYEDMKVLLTGNKLSKLIRLGVCEPDEDGELL